MTDAVLGNTYDLDVRSDFATIRRSTTDRALAARRGEAVVPNTAYFDDPHKFEVETQSPPISIAVGSARAGPGASPAGIEGPVDTSLRIREDGMREPHWHPITAELGYVQSGSGRMTVMNRTARWIRGTSSRVTSTSSRAPTRSSSRWCESPGWHFTIFFDQPTPGDIGYRASVSAYSREVLAVTFNTHIDDLPNFPVHAGPTR